MTSKPHGGSLVHIRPSAVKREGMEAVTVSPETQVTVQNIADGILSPLEGFMGYADYRGVIESSRLANDVPWSIPILLHVPDELDAAKDELCLMTSGGTPVATIRVEETFRIDRKEYCKAVFKTDDPAHPGVATLYSQPENVVAGRLLKVSAPSGSPFSNVTLTPRETRVLFDHKGWKNIVAFQTRNAPHIGHEYVQKTALALADGVFINPVLGKKKAGDFTDETIVATYQALMKHYYPANTAVMSVLHYEMQYAGPREAILHAIMRKNFGCTHIAIGRDHAGVGKFYGPYEAQEIFSDFPDLGITPLFFREFFYCTKCAGIANEKICPHPESAHLTFSGTKLRTMFQSGHAPPSEFMRPEVSEVILNTKNPFVE